MVSLMDTWGAFAIGVLVACFLGLLCLCSRQGWGPWLAPNDGVTSTPEPNELCALNILRAFNPVSNSIRALYRPAHIHQKPGYMQGLDGIRALAALWVLAWQLDEFLAALSDKYADSNWYRAKDEQVVPWKIASQGYEGLSIFLPLSAFLFTNNLLSAKQGESNLGGTLLDDSNSSFRGSFINKYMPVIWRRVTRFWPSLAASIFFVGFIWGEYINDSSSFVENHILDECKRKWWTNTFFIANFWKSTCFELSWAVSLVFQLGILVLVPVYLFSSGHKSFAYTTVYGFIFLSLLSRGLTVFLMHINRDPLEDYAVDNKYWLQRMPWCRAAEFSVGILCCFGISDAKAAADGKEKRDDESRADEETSLLVEAEVTHDETAERRSTVSIFDAYYLIAEPMREWLQSPILLFIAFVQTATIAVGFMFVYEGTWQYHEMNFNMTAIGKGVVLTVGDTIVASLFTLLIRWAVSKDYGGWLKDILSWSVWYPFASLSYNMFLYTYPAAFWANSLIPNTTKGNYIYFSKIYFLTLVFAYLIAFFMSIFIERPFISLSRMK